MKKYVMCDLKLHKIDSMDDAHMVNDHVHLENGLPIYNKELITIIPKFLYLSKYNPVLSIINQIKKSNRLIKKLIKKYKITK